MESNIIFLLSGWVMGTLGIIIILWRIKNDRKHTPILLPARPKSRGEDFGNGEGLHEFATFNSLAVESDRVDEMTQKHTPGPWPWKYTGDGKRIIIGDDLVEGPNGYAVAEVYSDDCPREEAKANAALIAAAPDLLEAVYQLLKCNDAASQQWAREAIAKAEGRA